MNDRIASVSTPARIDEHQERVEGDTNRSPLRAKYQQENLDEATHRLLEEDAEHFLHQSLSTPCIDALVEAEGVYLHDVSGRKIMDFHGNGVHHLSFGRVDDHDQCITALQQQGIAIDMAGPAGRGSRFSYMATQKDLGTIYELVYAPPEQT